MNLVPYDYKKYHYKNCIKQIGITCALLLSVVSLALSLSISLQKRQLTTMINKLSVSVASTQYEEMLQLEETIKYNKQLIAELKDVEQQKGRQKECALEHIRYLKLERKAGIIIESCYLDEVDKRYELKGKGKSIETILSYIETLKQELGLSNINFDILSKQEDGWQVFTICIALSGGEYADE